MKNVQKLASKDAKKGRFSQSEPWDFHCPRAPIALKRAVSISPGKVFGVATAEPEAPSNWLSHSQNSRDPPLQARAGDAR